MNVSSFIFSALPLMIQQYADFYKERDFKATLEELRPDLSIPRIETYDFIIGKATFITWPPLMFLN